MGRVLPRAAAAVLALLPLAAAPLPAAAGESPEERLFPSDGLDVVVLDDERVIRCRVVEEAKDTWTLVFPMGRLTVPRKGIEIRWFRDYDSTPRNPGEKPLADKGMVRFGGQWVSAAFAAERRAKEVDAIRRARADDVAHASWGARWKVPTEHFRLESNLPRSRVADYAALLEEFCKTVKDGLALAIPKEPLRVLVFRTRKEFTEFARKENAGLTEHVVGYYQPPSRSVAEYLALFDFRDDPEETLDTLLHEATHWIVHHGSSRDVMPWLNEGLAEYFGGSTYRYKKFQAGGIQDDRLLWFLEMVEDGRVIPLDDLVEVGGGSGPKFGLDHYAESWTFIHFLLHARQGSYRGAFRDSVRGFVRDCTEQLLHRMERRDFKKITEELVAYAKGLGEKLPLGPAYAERGLRRLGDENEKGAEADFRRALSAKDRDPRTLRLVALGFLRMTGKQEEAAGLLRKALEADPLDARTRARLAGALEGEPALFEGRLAACLAPDDAEILGSVARALGGDVLGKKLRVAEGAPKTRALEALDLASRAAEIGGADDDVVTATCLAVACGKFPDAVRLGETGLRSDPDEALLVALVAAARTLDGKPGAFAEVLGAARERWAAKAASAKGVPQPGEIRAKGPSRVESFYSQLWQFSIAMASQTCLLWDGAAAAADGLEKIYEARPPDTPMEWANLAGMLHEAGREERAKKVLEEARRRYPDVDAFDSMPDFAGPQDEESDEGGEVEKDE